MKLRIWPHLLKKPLMENLIFCAVCLPDEFSRGSKVSRDNTKLDYWVLQDHFYDLLVIFF